MKRVAVYGWYGHGNFGDELMLEGLKQLFEGWELLVFSDDAESIYPVIDFDVVNKCDLFVLGGGELINVDRLFVAPSWVQRVKIPKVILGCGVNAMSVNELSREVVSGLEQFNFIGLRDQFSMALLQGIPSLIGKVGLFYDLAFALDVSQFSWLGECGYVVVVPTDRFTNKFDFGVQEFNVASKSLSWLKHYLANYSGSVFLPFGVRDNDDYVTCRKMASHFKNSFVLGAADLSLNRVLCLMAGAGYVFAYRLHGFVLAFMLGVPCVFYPYHWKLQRVKDTLDGCSLVEVRQRQRVMFNAVIGGLV